jgi:hypothetical protein
MQVFAQDKGYASTAMLVERSGLFRMCNDIVEQLDYT